MRCGEMCTCHGEAREICEIKGSKALAGSTGTSGYEGDSSHMHKATQSL